MFSIRNKPRPIIVSEALENAVGDYGNSPINPARLCIHNWISERGFRTWGAPPHIWINDDSVVIVKSWDSFNAGEKVLYTSGFENPSLFDEILEIFSSFRETHGQNKSKI